MRLEPKTELMRNTYPAGAIVIFPCALFHLVPPQHVGLSWVGVAVGSRLMNPVGRSPKYRWLGHLTLLLALTYVLAFGATAPGGAHRIVPLPGPGSAGIMQFAWWNALPSTRSSGGNRPSALGTTRSTIRCADFNWEMAY